MTEFTNSGLFFFGKLFGFELLFSLKELSYFSELRWVTVLQISHDTNHYPHLSADTKNNVLQCSMRPLASHKVIKQRPVGVPLKTAINLRKPACLALFNR